jgi:hypothetical protein
MASKAEVVNRIGQIDSILTILQDLRRSEMVELEEIEPWPPIEGSFLWAMLEGMKAEGIEIPEKPAEEIYKALEAGSPLDIEDPDVQTCLEYERYFAELQRARDEAGS